MEFLFLDCPYHLTRPESFSQPISHRLASKPRYKDSMANKAASNQLPGDTKKVAIKA
jgi:hypothetical protein